MTHGADAIAGDGAPGEGTRSATWWYVPALLVLALLLLVSWRDDRPLHGDAAMYGAIAKTVLQTGDATHLTLNGRPYFNKPPMFFWLTAAAWNHLDRGTFAPLLVSGLLGVANVPAAVRALPTHEASTARRPSPPRSRT